jgi:threonine synthase
MFSSQLRCAGCQHSLNSDDEPFRCPRAGDDDVDHLVRRHLEMDDNPFPNSDDPNPFIAFRPLFVSYQLARRKGMTDTEYVDLVRSLNQRVAEVDGAGFSRTPLEQEERLGEKLGLEVWVKNETGNVSGSHKGRHLMGIAIYLEVLRYLGNEDGPRPRLAIASCGNAALAAATLARAAGYPIDVFIPTDANPVVVRRLTDLGASLCVSERREGESGDPCFLRFREAIAQGALPFGCQGSENGLTIEGGQTLGYELLSAHVILDRLLIQVGGGALASSVIQSLRDGVALGVLRGMPKIHSVQTEGASPLHRAYDRVAQRLTSALKLSEEEPARQAEAFRQAWGQPEVEEVLHDAAQHRSEFMWPWEEVPRSAAHGILDDETYDWLEIVRGMLESGGFPLTVDESYVLEAHRLAHDTTDISVSHTGSAGLAGLLHLQSQGGIASSERIGLLFTGVARA